MLYNNPPAYRVTIGFDTLEKLAAIPNVVAIKESAPDPRRITDVINRFGDRCTIMAGLDDVDSRRCCPAPAAGCPASPATSRRSRWRRSPPSRAATGARGAALTAGDSGSGERRAGKGVVGRCEC